jgi:hypothetical protein
MGEKADGEGGLDRFLLSCKSSPTMDDEPARRSLVREVLSTESRRWLDHIFKTTAFIDSQAQEEIRAVLKALDLIRSEKGPWHVSVLGARTGVASKFFRPGMPGRRRLANALIFLRGGADFSEEARENALEEADVVGSETAYGVLAAGGLLVDDLDFPARLAEKGQAVYLTLQNLRRVGMAPGVEGVLTIENEAPFLAALQEGLQKSWVLVATGGFPNRAVAHLLKSVIPRVGLWRHWGDTDLAGVQIARLLADRLGTSPAFFRCAADDVRRWRTRLIPLAPAEKKALATDLKCRPNALGADILRTALAEGGWLEQEAWEPEEKSGSTSIL